jgi:probable HAF family extracellular repeat protein
MNSTGITHIIVVTLLAIGLQTKAFGQEALRRHPRYKLTDMGTFGGPHSQVNNSDTMNKHGMIAGGASTSSPDPECALDPPFCFHFHALRWKNGILTDLGTLPGGSDSFTVGVNDRGWIAGFSDKGLTDPLTGGLAVEGVIWKHHNIIDLGTLGGNQSFGIDTNNSGQVIGWALNAIPSPLSIWGPLGTEQRAFLWQNGVMQDLGDLGGPSSTALLLNDRKQIVGQSFIDSAPDPATGSFTIHPFFWENGTMSDMGTLGGTYAEPFGLNSRGDVVGQAYLSGDQAFHPFLWSRGNMHDLRTFGGDFGVAYSINDKREAVGWAFTPHNQFFRATLWRQGKIIDLGSVGGYDCAAAFSINAKSQIVGSAQTCDVVPQRAFLWENGQIIDLNAFVPPDLDVTLFEPVIINDGGEIAVAGSFPNGDVHTFVLTPCEGKHNGCRGAARNRIGRTSALTATSLPSRSRIKLKGTIVPGLRSPLSRKYFLDRTTSPQK